MNKYIAIAFSSIFLFLFWSCSEESSTNSTPPGPDPGFCGSIDSSQLTNNSSVAYGFTAFTYDFTLEAINTTYEKVLTEGNLFVRWYDDCVPWYEMMTGDPLPDMFLDNISEIKSKFSEHNFTGNVLLAFAPTLASERWVMNADCKSLEDPVNTDSDPANDDPYIALRSLSDIDNDTHPDVNTALDSDSIPNDGLVTLDYENFPLNSNTLMLLYYYFVKQVIDEFDPVNIDYISLGIETGFSIKLNYDGFIAYSHLHQFARTNIKLYYPDIKFGFSISPYVWKSACDITSCTTESSIGELPAVRSFINDHNDYLGIGHYPNAAQYFYYNFASDENIFADGREGWQSTLEYIDNYSKSFTPAKPVGFLDTGVSSNTVNITNPISITIEGSDAQLAQWVYDLGVNAINKNYLFINWWNPIDYDPLWIAIGSPEATSIWVHMGLWSLTDLDSTPQLKEKEGLCVWRKVLQ